VVRYFKILPDIKATPPRSNLKNVGFVSLDIIYTAAGLATLLVASRPDWVAPIVAGYILLLVFSAFLDARGEYFTDARRLAAHVVVIAVIVLATVYTFQFALQGDPNTARDERGQTAYQFRVALPYIDHTLDQYIGRDRLEGRRLVYTVEVVASSRRAAEEKARSRFWTDTTAAQPYDRRRSKSVYTLSLVDNPTIEQLR